jgi:hypothetical protein
MTNMQH